MSLLSPPRKRLFIAAAISALLLACGKDDDAAPSSGGGGGGATTTAQLTITLDGDGFSAQAFTLTPIAGSGMALYSTADNETSGNILVSATNNFQLLFEGNTTGTQTCSIGTGPVGIGLVVNGQQYVHYTNTVNITEYGPVGGWVRGTLDGTLIRVNGTNPGTLVTVTNANFSFKRMSDV